MKSALIGFVLTAAMLTLSPGLLPSAWSSPAEEGGFAARHANENSAEIEAQLGLDAS
jgi:hypothetical protein